MAASAGVVAAFAFPLAASAKTVVVDANGPSGACAGTAPTCRSLTEASSSTVTTPGDTIEVRPGFYAESATFGQGDLTIKGTGSGPVLVVGTLTLTNPGSATVSRLILENAGGTPLVFSGAPPPVPLTHTIVVEGTALVAATAAPALTTNLSLLATETVNVVVRHVSAVNTGGPAISLGASGGTFSPAVKNSIALGGISPGSADAGNDDTTSSPTSLFCDAALHLVKGSPAIGAGGSLDAGEIDTDIDGEARGGTPDRGADQYSNKCDPTTNGPAPRPPTGGLPVIPGGPAAPTVKIARPGQGETLKRTSKHRRRVRRHGHTKVRTVTVTSALTIGGSATDPLGVSSVQLALRRTGTGTTTCSWFTGRKLAKVPCGQAVLLPAAVRSTAWSYTIPAKASLPKGSYVLYATAVNGAGVAATTFSPAAGNVVSFKIR
jgi:hypothetical protein